MAPSRPSRCPFFHFLSFHCVSSVPAAAAAPHPAIFSLPRSFPSQWKSGRAYPSFPPLLPPFPHGKNGRAVPAARSQQEVRHGSEAHPEGGGGSGRQDPGLPEDSRGAHPGSGGNIGYIRK